jgi:hypothetical protein
MRENHVMKSEPWIAIDLFTNEVLGNYADDGDAWAAWPGRAITVQFAPRARKVK